MIRLLLPFLLLGVANAFFKFHESALFDMKDFKGTPDYPINMCEVGCRVYLTYLNNELGDQDNGPITIIAGDNSTTFFDLNKLRLEDGQKGFFEIPAGTAEFTIHNPANNGATRPLALWVVQDNDLLNSVGVHDAGDGALIDTESREVVLMSVAAFTVNATIEGDYSLVAKTSPYDMINRDECQHVFTFNSNIGPAFSLPFNSPVITIGCNSSDPNFRMKLSINNEFPIERSIDASGYLASPGYIGCPQEDNGLDPVYLTFRSESYIDGISSFNETFLVDGDTIMNISFYGDLNTDESAPILLYDMDTDDEPMSIVGTQNDNTSTWEYELVTSRFSIHWDAMKWMNESFMIRYEVNSAVSHLDPKTTTVTLPKTSPTVPVKATSPTVPDTTPTEPDTTPTEPDSLPTMLATSTTVKSTSPTLPAVPKTVPTVPAPSETSTVDAESTVVNEISFTLTSTATELSTTSFSSVQSTNIAVFSILVVLLLQF